MPGFDNLLEMRFFRSNADLNFGKICKAFDKKLSQIDDV